MCDSVYQMVRNGEHKCSSRSDIPNEKTISEDQSANKVLFSLRNMSY